MGLNNEVMEKYMKHTETLELPELGMEDAQFGWDIQASVPLQLVYSCTWPVFHWMMADLH